MIHALDRYPIAHWIDPSHQYLARLRASFTWNVRRCFKARSLAIVRHDIRA